jgi:membrane carboxypeptidase/penicillin-binding protein
MLKTKLIRAGIFLAGFGFVAGTVLFALAWFTVGIPDPNAYVNSQSTIIQYSNGAEIGRIGSENRQILKMSKIPLRLRYAVMAAEDRNFYEHGGIDYQGLSRAVLKNVLNVSRGRRLEGGSTITQQVAKNVLLNSDVTFGRKFKEAILANRLEQVLSKPKILELYLNEIWLGYRSFGVGAAAYNYFGKPLSDLTLAETA